MTLHSPRIYTYKIIFEEVPYYYYGVHKERKFNEYYMGTPVTHKWCWKLYTPKKQILEFFEFSDEGWIEANKVEQRLIKPVYNTDKWCLNENCGGVISLQICREVGNYLYNAKLGWFKITKEERVEISRKAGHLSYINKTGLFSMTEYERRLLGIENGERNKKLKLGICGLSKEERVENGKKFGHIGGSRAKELGLGIHSLTSKEKSEAGKKSGERNKKLKLGICGLSKEERVENGKKSAKILNTQKWMCLKTGYITTSGPLTRYQKARGINISNRVKVM